MSRIRIAFSGIGAVGGYYGGLMAHHFGGSSDVEIIFISRGENLKVIKQKGLTIQTPFQTILAMPALITEQPEEIGVIDYLFCATKSYNLEENLHQLQPLIGDHTVIIPLLNGADIADRIKKKLPGHTVWKACVYIGARLKEPGLVEKFSVKDRFFFGGQDLKEKQSYLLELLLAAGINAFNPDDIDERIWKKFFMISTAATITSYYDLSIDKVISLHEDSFIELGNELKLVAEAKGIHLPEDIVLSSIHSQSMMPPGSTTSMHADFQRGSQTELETLTGYVVKTAEELGIDVPLYKKMYSYLLSKSH